MVTEAVYTSETSVNLYETTGCNLPEDSYFHSRRRENLKSQNRDLRKVVLPLLIGSVHYRNISALKKVEY
jgi:hypothetical protein